MDSPKKILILYASAGHGHEKAARAMAGACKKLGPQFTAGIEDTLKFLPGLSGKFYKESYLFQIQRLPWLWGFFYYSSDLKWLYFLLRPLRRLFNAFFARALEAYLVKENPDVVLCAHFMGIEVASFLKSKGKIRSKIFVIVTDYLPHCIWTAGCVDGYAVALEETKEALIYRGVAPEKIKALGIPVEEKFLQARSKKEVCQRLGLDEQRFTALLTSGGAGIGELEKIISGILKIEERIQVLVVCGTNLALKEKFERTAKSHPHLKVFGFVENMHELMDAADVVVGKAGGLTLTESLVKERPMILFHAVPGQETRNVFIVKKYGAGLNAHSVQEVISKVEMLSRSPEKMSALKENIRKMSKPLAASQIADWIQNELG